MASQRDLADQLLRRAAEDAAAAETLAGAQGIADAIVCFHAQQTIEKALKAVLANRGVPFAYKHDLTALLTQCVQAGIHLPTSLDEVDLLSPYATAMRYDDAPPQGVSRDTAVQWAMTALEWARAQLIG